MDGQLIPKRALIGPNFDYDVLENHVVVGRIFLSPAAPDSRPWMWTLAYGYHEDRTPTHGYEPTRKAVMAAFAKSWRRAVALPLVKPPAVTRQVTRGADG